jgi:uncharacterized protein YbdZ (MbtH family)
VVWIGTGEDLGGRHFGYGDGVYRSDDGGKTWTNMGLKNQNMFQKSLFIPMTLIPFGWHLKDHSGVKAANVVYIKHRWGKNWKSVLIDNEWTGATELVLDPRNPDRIYVAMWQRHRTIAAYMGGGPGSGIYRSDDGGETWKVLEKVFLNQIWGRLGWIFPNINRMSFTLL